MLLMGRSLQIKNFPEHPLQDEFGWLLALGGKVYGTSSKHWDAVVKLPVLQCAKQLPFSLCFPKLEVTFPQFRGYPVKQLPSSL